MLRVMLCAAALLSALDPRPAAAAPPPTGLSAADEAAAFKAAGFKQRGGKYVRCEEETPMASSQPGRIDVVDLNDDGHPEAWITESSLFCYGDTAEAFVLLTRGPDGRWRKLMDEVGVYLVLDSKHQGWPDVEVGGPGVARAPVHRWNGTTYVKGK